MTKNKIREAIEELKDLASNMELPTPDHIIAIKTVISYLETLQRVKEMFGVKRKDLSPKPIPESVEAQAEFLHERSKAIGFNQALNLKEAELAGKLEGLEEILASNYPDINQAVSDYEYRGDNGDYAPSESEKLLMEDFAQGLLKEYIGEITNKIQELFLGKKEG